MKRFMIIISKALREFHQGILKILGRNTVKVAIFTAGICVFTSCSPQTMSDFIQGEEGVLERGLQDEASYLEGMIK